METTEINTSPTPDPTVGVSASWRPADYYSTPPRPARVPRWLTLGCGGVAVLAVVAIFVAGAVLSTSAINEFMDMALGMTLGEVRGMYAKDLTAAQKKSFEDEVEGVRKNLREGKISVRDLDPLMQSLRAASSDSKIQRAELEQARTAARKINAGAKK